MIPKFWPIALILVSLIPLVGCGKGNELGRVSVRGEVTFEGKPLDRGSIEFTPTGEGTQSGAVIENGVYEISETRGLPPGEYLVRISSASDTGETVEAPGESSAIAKERIPAEFNVNSDKKIQVEEGKENVFNFAIPKSQ